MGLLYELCVGANWRGASTLLEWLAEAAAAADREEEPPPGAVLACVAAVIWAGGEELAPLLTEAWFERVWAWVGACGGGDVKAGLDHVLCAACHVRPQLFSLVLARLGVHRSDTDDTKERQTHTHAKVRWIDR